MAFLPFWNLKRIATCRFRQDSAFVVLECRVPHPHEGIHLWKKKDKKNKNNVQWLYKQEHVVVSAITWVGWHKIW